MSWSIAPYERYECREHCRRGFGLGPLLMLELLDPELLGGFGGGCGGGGCDGLLWLLLLSGRRC